MRARGIVVPGAMGPILALTLAALAAEEPQRKVGIEREEGRILVSFGYTDIFDKGSPAKLASGLPTTVLMRMSLVQAGKKTPLAFTLRSAVVTYDLWD
jgi:hypothetical protein